MQTLNAINWGRIWSLWPVHLETACCSVEFGAASGPRYDVERFGIIEAFGSLRQCDLVVVQGTVTRKMAPRLRMVYDQMPDPKYVIAMGSMRNYWRFVHRFIQRSSRGGWNYSSRCVCSWLPS
jgi:NADH:ubiquinone oxidoreductase subunit B-like Fe-S oxidoreductase